jgi:hypothetical protein
MDINKASLLFRLLGTMVEHPQTNLTHQLTSPLYPEHAVLNIVDKLVKASTDSLVSMEPVSGSLRTSAVLLGEATAADHEAARFSRVVDLLNKHLGE